MMYVVMQSDFLCGEEGLGLSAGGVGAEGASEGELAGARLVGAQVRLDQLGQRLHEERISIQRLCSSNILRSTLLPQHLAVLYVQLVQRLDVVGGEGYGHQQEVPLPSLTQTLDHIVCLGP